MSKRFPISRFLFLVGLFLVAFGVRAYYLYEYSQSDLWDLLSLDPNVHDLMAREIMETGSLGDGPYFRAPFYPYTLGLIYTLFGPTLLIPRLLNILCGALSCVLLYLIGEKLVGKSGALAVFILACFYWIFIYFEGELLLVALYIFLILLSLYLLTLSQGQHPKLLLGAGMVLGLSVITRPNVIVFFPFILIWLKLVYRDGFTGFLKRSVLFFAPALLIVFSVTLRNHVVGQDRVFLAYQAGVNFYIGNNADSNGRSAQSPYDVRRIPDAYKWKHKDNIWINDDVWLSGYFLAEMDAGKDLKPSQMQSYWFDRAFDSMLNNKAAYLKLLLKKCYFFINAYEIPNNRSLYKFIEQVSPLLQLLSHLDFGIIISCALMGMGLCLSQWRRFFLFYSFVFCYSLTNIGFFINTRYRVPIIPVLLIFGVFFVIQWIGFLRKKKRTKSLVCLFFLGGLLYLSHTELFGIRDNKVESVLHYNNGNAYMEKGKLDEALREYKESARLYGLVSAPYENICAVLNQKEEYDQVITWAEEGLKRFPSNAVLHTHYGTALLRKGQARAAAAHFEMALSEDPGNPAANLNLGVSLYEDQRFDEAKTQFQKCLEMVTENKMVFLASHVHLGWIAMKNQSYHQAKIMMKNALMLQPDNIDALLCLGQAQMKLKEYEKAKKTLNRLIRKDPENKEAKKLLESIK